MRHFYGSERIDSAQVSRCLQKITNSSSALRSLSANSFSETRECSSQKLATRAVPQFFFSEQVALRAVHDRHFARYTSRWNHLPAIGYTGLSMLRPLLDENYSVISESNSVERPCASGMTKQQRKNRA